MPDTLLTGRFTGLQLQHGAAPASPASGYTRAFVGTDGLLYTVDSTGAVHGPMEAPVIDARAHGVTANGTTDDTTALQAALTAAASASHIGAVVQLPPGIMKISATLTVSNVQGLRLLGAGLQTQMRWYGNATDPFLKVIDSRDCVIGGFVLYAGASFPCAIGIYQYHSHAGGTVATSNSYRDIWLQGEAGYFYTGIKLGGADPPAIDTNNDLTGFDNIVINNYRDYGWDFDGWQEYQNDLHRCYANAYQAGSVAALGGVRIQRGQVRWHTGGSNSNAAALVIDGSNLTAPLIMENIISEGDTEYVHFTGAGNNVEISGGRWAANAVASGHKFATLGLNNVIIHNCEFGDGAGGSGISDFNIDWAGEYRYTFAFYGNTITATSPTTVYTTLFSGAVPTTSFDNKVFDEINNLNCRLPDQFPVTLTVNSTTPTLRAASLALTANTTATTITDILEPEAHTPLVRYQRLTILINDANTTFSAAGNLHLAGGVAWTPSSGDTLTLLYDGTAWREIARRSAGGGVSLAAANTWTAEQTIAPATDTTALEVDGYVGGTADVFNVKGRAGTVVFHVDAYGNSFINAVASYNYYSGNQTLWGGAPSSGTGCFAFAVPVSLPNVTPATPASGTLAIWFDGTDLKTKDSSGTVKTVTRT